MRNLQSSSSLQIILRPQLQIFSVAATPVVFTNYASLMILSIFLRSDSGSSPEVILMYV